MNKKINQLEEIGKENPFKVPKGYFEGLTDRIMSELPERVVEEQKPISLWTRVQPWVYMAAMFVGIALMVRLFVGSPERQSVNAFASEGIQLESPSDIEDFYGYYEDQLANLVYREAFYELYDESE